MSRLMSLITLLCVLSTASADVASAQSKSCYDQWYDLRVKSLNGVMPRNGIQTNADVRKDIEACEASQSKKFVRIASKRQ